ncbi:UvrD-helicase domain-containing protein [Pseudomonas sp. NPDC089401]|uniref:UvrD-helicase domain-containing protein n=1 Tax=Pseudomonas sp. NPDC089401 TaxID=3364462 RepID=UPI0037F701A4
MGSPMIEAEVNLLQINRGTVTAPAGCGKTQLIAKALASYQGSKPILVLTHTNAGVAALRARLDRAGVRSSAYRLSTIDGWAMRLISTFPARSGHDPAVLNLKNASRDYPVIREAAWRLLQAGHANDVIRSSYAQLIVDEYQDCSVPQHTIVYFLSHVLPTCVLGDPMQAIFGFPGNALADWNQHVCAHFPVVHELQTPWRWNNAGEPVLGTWLLQARHALMRGERVDLRLAPPQVTWVPLAGADDHPKRLAAARTASPIAEGRVLIIGDSTNPESQRNIASQTPGAVTVEAVDLRDLLAFGRSYDPASQSGLADLMAFAQSVMTNLGVPAFLKRLESLAKGTARNPATKAETAARDFQVSPSFDLATHLLMELRAQPDVRVHRPAILYSALKAMRQAASGTMTFEAATQRVREDNRMQGRPLPKRAVGSTLLLKGLEAEVAVIMNGDGLDARNLYVAMSRGSMRLVVCSVKPVLGG